MNLLGAKQEIVLKKINRFGVITSTQLIEFLEGEVSHVTVYNTRKKLTSLGFIGEEKIGYQLILYMKPSGVEYLGSELTAFTKINFSMLKHQLIMNDCIVAFKKLAKKKGVDFSFLTERELRSSYLTQNFSKEQRRNTTLLKKVPDRIPDFVLFEGENKVACEVELTQKSSKRYERKFDRYKDEILNGEYSMVRYLCDDEQIQKTVEMYASSSGLDQSMFQRELIRRLIDIAEK
ncbi:hypothetical protein [Virgibacillus salexigens]|uniref:hypothetical protein n=1 Tax=Virgibacillus massiliensis TaxID=1462526 RepID=UPI001F44E741|nr:hypothetical protein [Virgibacillus massiliensis]